MHDPKIIEAMARALRSDDTLMLQSLGLSCEDVCGGDLKCVERGLPRCDIQTTQSIRAVHIALAALCTLRPDVAAVLRGEAVAVPREPTMAMVEAMTDVVEEIGPLIVGGEIEGLWADALAASPYAAKETRDDR